MNRFRQFFLNDLGLKAVSLLLAMLLWHQVTSQDTVQRNFSAPIAYRNLPEGLVISNDPPRNVEVMLRTNRRTSSVEAMAAIEAVIDLKDTLAGITVINLTESQIVRPSFVDVLQITPSRIRLNLEVNSNKRVKVDPMLVGEPAEDYEVVEVQVIPPDILISGPESHVQGVSSVPTGPIDIAGRSAAFRESVFIDLEDTSLRIGGATTVDVVVSIEEKRRGVTVRNVSTVMMPEGVRARLLTRTVNLDGSVPISYTGELEAKLFSASVDLSGLDSQQDTQEVVPTIMIPDEYRGVFRLEQIVPEKVKIRKLE